MKIFMRNKFPQFILKNSSKFEMNRYEVVSTEMFYNVLCYIEYSRKRKIRSLRKNYRQILMLHIDEIPFKMLC